MYVFSFFFPSEGAPKFGKCNSRRYKCLCAAVMTHEMIGIFRGRWAAVLFTVLIIPSHQALGASPSQNVAYCRLHTQCEASGHQEFCAAHSCSSPEGASFTCGICKPCAVCENHGASIDAQCPPRCGTPFFSTPFVRGHFYSVDAAECLTGGNCQTSASS